MSKNRKRKRREPDNDGDHNMPESDPTILVRCVTCHVLYNTTLRAFNNRGCACPKCGVSKAQLIDESEKPTQKTEEAEEPEVEREGEDE